ncbi:hypothetical protein [Streptomyces sp. 8N616]
MPEDKTCQFCDGWICDSCGSCFCTTYADCDDCGTEKETWED